MAAKKSAKNNMGNTVIKEKALPGKMVKYFGSKNAPPFICPTCNKSLIKGMILEDNSKLYCSRTCIPKVEA